MEQNKKFRNYCMTDFICDRSVYDTLSPKYKYILIGEETCPTTQKTHFQVFLVCKSPRSLKSVMKEWAPRHIEICKGDYLSNIKYCSKDDKITEYGERPKGQGKRSDIELVREVLESEEATMREISSIATSYQSIRVAETFLSYNERRRTWKPNVSWIYGATGTGKTKQAVEMCGDNDYWMSGKNLRWWQGYDGHSHIIIDDFRKDFCTFHELLRILDRYAYSVEVKGGSRQLLATDIIITCPYHPLDVYNTREDVGQLIRRIDDTIMLEMEHK